MQMGIPEQMPSSVNSCDFNNAPMLSAKATSSAHGEDSPYFDGWKEYDRNPYHPQKNPYGVIQMGLAENQLCFDLLEQWVADHPEASICRPTDGIPSSFREVALYQDYHGMPRFRMALAKFMQEQRGGKVKFDPDRIIPTAGATAAQDLLTFCLADPGEAFLVPSPYYPGFDRDLKWRTGAELIPVDCYSSNNFQVTRSALERAYGEARSRNIAVKGVILTNPSNPLGTTVGAETLGSLLEFVTEKNIHLICDEIYSGTVFSSPRFVSIEEVLSSAASRDRYSNRVHIIYSLSKDLGLPGFRVGVVYSNNDAVVTAARRMSSFCLVSSQTQHLLAALLSDSQFVQKYTSENAKRLRERHRIFTEGLKEAGIECLKSNGGLFCWVNLTNFLPSPDQDGEMRLWKLIVRYVGLNVSPGCSFHCREPGWFRFCFANMDEHTLKASMERIQRFTILYKNYIKPLRGCIDALLKIKN